ncbi:ATP-binding protein, partial [Scytonema sp. NUACC21]
MSDRTNHVTSTFWGCVQNSNVVTAGGDVQLTLANGTVLSVRQEDWVDFSDLITKVTQRLVGRGFVFEKVADFIESNPRGYFRVIADAGLGKTAIAAELIKRYRAVACFISASENRTQPERIINVLSAQLIASYALPYNSLPVRAGETSDWFYQRLREAASQPENRPVVVIIDAIDEADAPAPTRNWLYLPRDLPQGVYIILTHRPGDYLLTTVPNLPSSEQVITWDDPKQQSDIELHLRCQAEQPEIHQLLEKTTPSISVEEFVSELQKASQGNFMYLEYVLADIVAGNSGFNPLNLKELPQGLRGYYAQFWSGMEVVRHKEGWSDWNSLYRPIIELLGVALESVSVQWLADHIRRDTNEIRV